MSELESDRPRLLSARPGADYVQSTAAAMRGEPEAPSEADLAAYVDEAHARDDERDQAAAAALTAAMLPHAPTRRAVPRAARRGAPAGCADEPSGAESRSPD